MKILFFTPQGGRTGSEKLLWYMLQHFDRSQMQAALYCEQNGAMANELPADVPFFTSAFVGTTLQKLYAKTLNAVGLSVYESHIDKIHQRFGADTWYLNTIMMAPIAKFARKRGVKLVFHVHELESMLDLVTHEDLHEALSYASLVIATSESVARMLHGMGAKNVEVVYPFVDLDEIKLNPQRASQIRAQNNIAADAFVWVMSGSPIYKKGVDIFPQIAQQLAHKNYHFVWLGSTKKSTGASYLAHQRAALGGLSNVSFLEPQASDYYDYLNMADGFVLTSREEPFGMVLIEAAHLGKPIVAFDAGGPAEFVKPDIGLVVPPQNMPEMVRALEAVADGKVAFDPATAQRQARAFDAKTSVQHWQHVLSNHLKK